MSIGLTEAAVVALIGAAFLKPEELRHAAKKIGGWLGEAQKLSRGFMSELAREADVEDIRETTRALKQTIADTKELAGGKALNIPTLDELISLNLDGSEDQPTIEAPQIASPANESDHERKDDNSTENS